MKVLKSDEDFGREETDHVLVEHFSRLPFKKQEKLTTGAKIGNQADMGLSLQKGQPPQSSSTSKNLTQKLTILIKEIYLSEEGRREMDLEGGVESGKERMIQKSQDVPLCSCSMHLVTVHHHTFVHGFHGKY